MHAFNAAHKALTLLNKEVGKFRTAVLHYCMALDMLTTAQGGVCADGIHTECCVYNPDVQNDVTLALQALQQETQQIIPLAHDPLVTWSSQFPQA